VYTPRILYIRQRVFYSTFSRRQTGWRQVRETTLRLRKAADMCMPTKITCIVELEPKEEQNVYGRVKSDYMYNESFSTSRLLILYAALVTVLFLPHCPPLPYRADMPTPAFYTPPFFHRAVLSTPANSINPARIPIDPETV